MNQTKSILFRAIILITLLFTLSSCGLIWGRGWGCGGPYYDERGPNNQNSRNYNNN